MTSPEKLLARLASHGIDYQGVTGGTPGLGITPEDVAGAMQGLDRGAYLLLLRKWVLDTSVQNELFYRVYVAVAGLAADNGWKVPKGQEYLRKLARLAVAEIVDPMKCSLCKGRTEIWKRGENKPVVCPKCSGTGYGKITAAERYKTVGIDKRNWERTWADRYEMIYKFVNEWEHEALRAIRRNIRCSSSDLI